MKFANMKSPMDFSYGIDESVLRKVKLFKYVNTIFSSNFKWDRHVDFIWNRALRKLGYVKRTYKHATKKAKLIAVKSLAMPILQYGCVV